MSAIHSICHVAVIDNDEAVLDSLRFSLGLDGFEVTTYSSGADFFAASPSSPFCCVIVDQNMPDMTGLEVALRLRASEAKLPIIMLTGGLTDSLEAKALTVGVSKLVAKPPREGYLEQAIRQLLAMPKRRSDFD